MKTINERLNDTVILTNISEFPITITINDFPRGKTLTHNENVIVRVSDLMASLRNDKFVYGVDGLGANAAAYIDDADIRELLKFDIYEDIPAKGKVAEGKERKIEHKLVKEQVVLSKEVFISKLINYKSNKEADEYIESLSKITNGQKMMVSSIIAKERKGKLSKLSSGKLADLEDIIKK